MLITGSLGSICRKSEDVPCVSIVGVPCPTFTTVCSVVGEFVLEPIIHGTSIMMESLDTGVQAESMLLRLNRAVRAASTAYLEVQPEHEDVPNDQVGDYDADDDAAEDYVEGEGMELDGGD